jgi:ribonuclease VapC
MEQAERVLVSTVSVVEARMVVSGRRGERGVVLLDDLFRLPMIEVVAVGVAEMDAAYAAFVLYGRGSGHPAALSFGDVFSYALAKVRGLASAVQGRRLRANRPSAGTGPLDRLRLVATMER